MTVSRLAKLPTNLRATALGANASLTLSEGDEGQIKAVVTGELDLACADALAAALCRALDEHVLGVELDVAGVGFFDCAAMNALDRAVRHAERRGCDLTFGRSSDAVDLVLDLAAPRWRDPALG